MIGLDLKILARVAVTVIILAVLFSVIGVEDVFSAFASADVTLLAVAFLFVPVALLIKFLRWSMVVGVEKRLPFRELCRIYLIGLFFGMVTPSKLGDLMKFHYLSKKGVSKPTALSLSFSERIFDTIIMLSVSIAGVFILLDSASIFSTAVFAFAAVFIAGFYFIFNKVLFLNVMRFFISKVPFVKNVLKFSEQKKERVLEELYSPFEKLLKNPRTFVGLLAVSFLLWFVIAVEVVVIVMAFGGTVGVWRALMAICLGGVIGLLPITVSGVGTRDAAVVFIFVAAGLDSGVALVSSLVYTFFAMVVPALVGGVLYIKK